MASFSAAALMRKLSDEDRDAAIAGCDKVLDGRGRFDHARKQAQLSKAYRKPQKPEGAA